MIATYNYPGSSSFTFVYYRNNKKSKSLVQEWWAKVHEGNGSCAPGGGLNLTDTVAKALKYMDGSHVFNFVQHVETGVFIKI